MSRKERISVFVTTFVACIFAHFAVLINIIKNADCWQYSTTYQSGAWEVSIGRWLIPVIDMLRGRLNIPYITAGLAFFWVSLASVFFSDIFALRLKSAVVVAVCFAVAPWMCGVLPYSYCCDSYALGFFLSIFSVWCTINLNNKVVAFIGKRQISRLG